MFLLKIKFQTVFLKNFKLGKIMSSLLIEFAMRKNMSESSFNFNERCYIILRI